MVAGPALSAMLELGINATAEHLGRRLGRSDFQIGLLAACKDLPRHVSQPFQGVQCASVRSSHFPVTPSAQARDGIL